MKAFIAKAILVISLVIAPVDLRLWDVDASVLDVKFDQVNLIHITVENTESDSDEDK